MTLAARVTRQIRRLSAPRPESPVAVRRGLWPLLSPLRDFDLSEVRLDEVEIYDDLASAFSRGPYRPSEEAVPEWLAAAPESVVLA